MPSRNKPSQHPSKSDKHKPDAKAVGKPSKQRIVWLISLLFVLVVVFFATGGVASFCASMGRNAVVNQEWEKADRWLATAHRFSPTNSYVDYLRAQSSRRQGDLASMGEHLKAALDHGYDRKLLEKEQTLAMASMGRIDEQAERQIKSWMIEPGADVADILRAYTNGLVVLSKFDEANLFFNLWEEKLPDDPTPNYRRGRLHEHSFKNVPAEEEYRKAIAKDPNFVNAKYSLARLLLFLRQPQEALKFFEECNQGKFAIVAQIGMAQCYKDLGEVEQSREILKKIVAMDKSLIEQSYKSVDENPERYIPASDLGVMETELGNFEDAKKLLEQALESNPLDSIARYSYAVALRGLGMEKEAEENFEKTRASREALDQVTVLKERINRNAQDTESRLAIGKIVLENESERSGIYWIQSIFAYDPSNYAAHKFLAEFYASKPDRDKYRQLIEYHRNFLINK